MGSGMKEANAEGIEQHDSELGEGISSEVEGTIQGALESLDAELRELSLNIHDRPELMFEEHYAHDTLTEFMGSHGFTVTKHFAGMDTAWRAAFSHGDGSRFLGVNSEMDALPGMGHACGHNLIAIAGVGIALSVAEALKKHDIPGKIVLLGTPAEEGGYGKVTLLQRGAYAEMDACIMCHPGPGPDNSVGLPQAMAIQAIKVEYTGKSAHAAGAPWEGQNALDAAFLAYGNISAMRQQMKPTHRVHGVVTGKEWRPQIIPDNANMVWNIRAPSFPEVDELRRRVVNCFEAAALASGCKVEISAEPPVRELRQNTVLGHAFSEAAKRNYGMETVDLFAGSTDFGNVTYELPAIHPGYAIPTEPGVSNHNPAFAKSARTEEAHAMTLKVAGSLAMVGVRVLQDSNFDRKVKEGFDS